MLAILAFAKSTRRDVTCNSGSDHVNALKTKIFASYKKTSQHDQCNTSMLCFYALEGFNIPRIMGVVHHMQHLTCTPLTYKYHNYIVLHQIDIANARIICGASACVHQFRNSQVRLITSSLATKSSFYYSPSTSNSTHHKVVMSWIEC